MDTPNFLMFLMFCFVHQQQQHHYNKHHQSMIIIPKTTTTTTEKNITMDNQDTQHTHD